MPRHVSTKDLDLDLLHVYTSTVAETINAVPGLRTSAAFFSFLRANLVLPPSTLNSTTSTPLLDPSSSQTLPSLLPSSLASMTSTGDEVMATPPNPLEDVPALTTTTLTREDDKVAGLKIIADSIAQQRQFAARAIIFHPATIAAYIGLLGMLLKCLYTDRSDLGIFATTSAGVTMAVLVAIRGYTAGYIHLAESFDWDFAKNEDGEEDVIIGSRYGNELIGAAILRLERSVGSPKRKGKGSKNGGGKGIVRAWSVANRYRGKGVGTELLEEVVRLTREKLGNSAEIGFAAEHANSKTLLPALFNGGFKKREAQAAQALENVVQSMEGKKKR